MRHLLVIAYEFPPYVGSGVFRTVKFVKYLPQSGWRSTVLSAKFGEEALAARDEEMIRELPPSTRIVRAWCLDAFSLYRRMGGRRKSGQSRVGAKPRGVLERVAAIAEFLQGAILVPDSKIGWFPDGVRLGHRLFFQDRPDAIFSTSPRETAHLIAMELSRRHGVPWVADFRDPWTGAFFKPRKVWPFSRLDAALEARVIRSARAITIAWPGLKRALLQKAPETPPEKIHLITNGFDPEDFRGLQPVRDRRFTIVHTGRFLPKHRGPEPLLAALRRWLDEDPSVEGNVSVRFVGPGDFFVSELVAKYGLSQIVSLVGSVPHREALRHALGADCLFFMNSFAVGRDEEGVDPQEYIPGKIFDYLGAGRPILALAQEGSASAQILSTAPQATVLHTLDPEPIRHALAELYAKRGTVLPRGAPCEMTYTRAYLAARLAALLDSLCKR